MSAKTGRDEALSAQLAECRQQLTEARAATKDLRAALRDARELMAELAARMVDATTLFDDLAQARIEAAVEREIGLMTQLTLEATDKAVARIDVRFDEYTGLLMTGSASWVTPKGKNDLRPKDLIIGQGHPLHGEFPPTSEKDH